MPVCSKAMDESCRRVINKGSGRVHTTRLMLNTPILTLNKFTVISQAATRRGVEGRGRRGLSGENM